MKNVDEKKEWAELRQEASSRREKKWWLWDTQQEISKTKVNPVVLLSEVCRAV